MDVDGVGACGGEVDLGFGEDRVVVIVGAGDIADEVGFRPEEADCGAAGGSGDRVVCLREDWAGGLGGGGGGVGVDEGESAGEGGGKEACALFLDGPCTDRVCVGEGWGGSGEDGSGDGGSGDGGSAFGLPLDDIAAERTGGWGDVVPEAGAEEFDGAFGAACVVRVFGGIQREAGGEFLIGP